MLTVEEMEEVSRVLQRKSQMDTFHLAYQALASGKFLAVSLEQTQPIFGRLKHYASKKTIWTC